MDQRRIWSVGGIIEAWLSLLRLLLAVLYRVYKACISPLFGNACRFYPSCSDYARLSIERYGWLKGGSLACKRVCRCHPWHPGGDDPVP